MTGWKTRLEALVGDLSHLNKRDPDNSEMDTTARLHFENLSQIEIADIRKRYGGNWLLTKGHYPYTTSFNAGAYAVYKLP